MFRTSNKYPVLIAVIALVCLTAGIVSAATVTQNITYQGKLTNAAGNSLTGTYNVTFRIYDASTGGTTLSTDTRSVTAANGLFTTALAVENPALADGRALWLGVKVEKDPEMNPRQEIRPVPYAFSLRPGARVQDAFFSSSHGGTSSSALAAAVNVSTAYPYNPGIAVRTDANNSAGLYAQTQGGFSYGVYARTLGFFTPGIYAVTSGDSSAGVSAQTFGTGSDGFHALTVGDESKGAYAETHGANSPAVYGLSEQDVGVFGIGKTGGYFTTNQAGTSGNPWAGVNVSTQYIRNPGVLVNTGGSYSSGVGVTTSGDDSYGVRVSTSGDESTGVWATAVGRDSPAMYGWSLQDVGVYGSGKEGAFFTTHQGGTSVSTTKAGVNVSTRYNYNPGVQVNTVGSNSAGVSAQTSGLNSPALYGSSQQDVGVSGIGKTGGFFTTNQAGTSISGPEAGVGVSTSYTYNPGIRVNTGGDWSRGVAARTSGSFSPGMYAETHGSNSSGVQVHTDGTWSKGVRIETNGDSSDGVTAFTKGAESRGVTAYTWGSPNSNGVQVFTYGDDSDGVNARTFGPNSVGMFAWSNQSHGIYTETHRSDHKYGLYTPDYIYARGTQYPAADVAEYMPVTDDATPGTVLVIGADGRLTPATSAYDTRVAGIVSTDPGVFLGTKEDGNEGEALIAIAGRVPCKVDASYGAIRPGDLLATSDTPGHAMKAEPTMISGRGFYPDGTILGKAMGSLESGTGTIEVLVTLQ